MALQLIEKRHGALPTLLKMFGLPTAKEAEIRANDKSPGWTVIKIVHDLDKLVQHTDVRNLILGHYTGHHGLASDGLLIFYDPLNKRQFLRMFTTFRGSVQRREKKFRPKLMS